MDERRSGTTRDTATPAGPKVAFAEQFRRLYTAAGEPPLRRIADAAGRSGPHGSTSSVKRGATPSAQRISDWKSGTNVPATFEALSPVLLVLIDRVRRSGAEVEPELLDTRLWRQLWQAASKPEASVATVGAEQPCPYLGLAAYRRDDAARFFGRTRPTADLVALVTRAASTGGLTVLVGASGAGKSSLLAAGLIPALTGPDTAIPDAATWPVTAFTPGATPLAALPTGPTRGLVVVDQFEELFTVCDDEADREAFIAALAALADDAVVVLGVRADFYARCLDYPELEAALQHRSLVLGPMRITELREAISGPARAAGLRLEPGLEDLVIDDLHGIGGGDRRRGGYDPGALPLLSHVLAGTWRHRRGGKLTLAGYREAEGVAGSVAATAGQMWAGLDAPAQAAARRILLRLVQIGDESRDSRRPRPREELLAHFGADRPAAVDALEALTKSRLVTVDSDVVTLTHEIVIDAWPLLRGWIDEDRAGNLVRQRVEADAAEWVARGRDTELLYRGGRLETAQRQTDPAAHDISTVVAAFLADSTSAARRNSRRSQAVRIGLVLLTAVALLAAGIAVFNVRGANAARDRAIFGQVSAEANRVAASDPSLSAQLNLVAHDLRPDDSFVYTQLISSTTAPLATPLAGHRGAVYLVAFSPDGATLASASYDNTVRLWDVSDRAAPRALGELTGHTSWVTSVVFSPDGRTLASTSDDRTVRLWDVTDPGSPRGIGELTGHTETVFLAAYSPDGRTLATASFDQTIKLWDIPAASLITTLTGSTGPVRSLAYSPDGATLASGGNDMLVRLWDVRDPATAAPLGVPLAGHTDVTHALAFAPDGRTLASGSDDRTVRLWNTTDPGAPTPIGQPFTGHTGPVWSVAFDHSGSTLITGSLDGTAQLWNLANPAVPIQLGQPLAGTNGSVYTVAFSPDGTFVASGGADGLVRLWTVPSTVLNGHTGRVGKIAFSGDGTLLATSSFDGAVQIWRMTDPAHPDLVVAYHDPDRRSVWDVSLRPDGRVLATGFRDGTIALWSIDGNRLTPLGAALQTSSRYPSYAVFSPDGRVLATPATDESTQLWDVADPASPRKLGTPLAAGADWANAVAFDPSGSLLAVASADHRISMWRIEDPEHPQQAAELTGHDGAVNTVAFSPDGTRLASAGDDQDILLWDVTDPAAPTRAAVLAGHTSTVRSLAFSADGATLVSAGDGRIVRLWDVDSAEPIGGSLVGGGSGRWNATFSPSGPIVAAGGDGGAVVILDLDAAHATERICRFTGNVLTPDEWDRHLATLDYNPPCDD